MGEKYVYHGIDITLDMYEKISSVVEILSDMEKKSFDDTFALLLRSSLYSALQNPDTALWAESAEFLADEYYRRQNTEVLS